jgi:hypothetical protein
MRTVAWSQYVESYEKIDQEHVPSPLVQAWTHWGLHLWSITRGNVRNDKHSTHR